MHNISITPKKVKKFIRNLEFSKTFDCTPEVALENCEPELSYILAELINGCCFPDRGKVSLVVLVFRNVWEESTAKNYHLVSFFLLLVNSLKNL